MLLRAIAIVISVLLHAWTGNAMWSLLAKDKPEVFNPGEGMDIVLEPPALVASEVTSVGDSTVALQSLDAVAAVAAPPPAAAPVPEAGEQGRAQPPHLAAATPAEPSQIAAAAPEQLPEVIDSIESKTAAQVAAAVPRQPPPPRTRDLPPGELADVITSQQGAVDDAVPEADETAPDDLVAQAGATPGRTVAPQDVTKPLSPETDATEPLPETFTERRLALAARPVSPDEIKEPAPVVSNRRPEPEALDARRPGTLAKPVSPEAARPVTPPAMTTPRAPAPIAEARVTTTTTAPRPPELIDEQAPETIEVIAQPQQIVIVTELSSGEEKTGGDATQAGIYLGRISEQVQRAKVNPRSRMTGTTVLKFTVGVDGRLLSKEVAQSSGHPVLDDAAVTTLDRAAPFPPIPPDVSKTPMTFQQPFRFVVR